MNVTEKLTNVPKPKRLRDYIALLLDDSGSMQANADRAYGVLREQFENIGRLQEDTSRDVYLNYYTFSNEITPHVLNTRGKVNVPDRSHYLATGASTALRDAIVQATTDLMKYEVPDTDSSFLVVVITDGEENSSHKFSAENLRSLIVRLQQRGNWTFVVLGPRGCRSHCFSWGIPGGNVEEWDSQRASEYGRISTQTAGSTQSYYTARSAGVRSTRTFFQPDLHAFGVADAKRQLTDVTDRYRRVVALKEIDIKTFVEYHTGRPYEPGGTFYMLTKPEEVQDGKQILLRDRDRKAVYADAPYTVRAVLGFPERGKIKVKPGDHHTWEIFIQSKSTNRKLVRGTNVLIRK